MLFANAKTTVLPEWKRLQTELTARHLAVEQYDLTTAAAQAKAHLYDIAEPSSVVVARDDGAPVMSWRAHLPTAAEISYSLGYI